MNKLLILCMLCMAYTAHTQSLTDAELNNRYWTYKDRFLKRFTYVGKKNGESTVVIKYTKQTQTVIDKNTGHDIVYTGKLEFGDALVDQGLYLSVLATEYKLLKDAGKDLTAIRNELYYAIEAVNRLDENAEKFYGQGTGILNGFCIRTDAPDGFYERFEAEGDEVHFQSSDASQGRKPVNKEVYNGHTYWTDKDGNFIKEDWYNEVITDKNGFNSYESGVGYGRRANEMSQDQIFGVMIGLGFIVKLVDNEYVRPIVPITGSLLIPDRGFNLVDEAKLIVERLIDNLSARKTVDAQTEGVEGFTPDGDYIKQISADWMAVNTVKNKCVARGPLSTQLGFSYPAIKAAGNILGNEKSSWYPNNFIDIWYRGPVTTNFLWPTLPPPAPSLNSWLFFGNTKYQFPIKPQAATFWAAFGNSSALVFYNRNHIWKLGCMSGLVDQKDFHDFCTVDNDNKPDKTYIEIINAVYNNHTPIKEKEYYRTVLSNDACMGNTFFGSVRPQYGFVEDMWSMNTYLDDNGNPREGEYNGLDWMLLHNLFRLAFKNDMNNAYTQLGCPCQSSKQFYAGNDPHNVHYTAVSNLKNDLPFRFPGYKDYAIPVPEWLTKNYYINNGGTLKPQGDLTICGSTTTIYNGGVLSTEVNTNSNWSKIIKAGKGAIIEIKSGGTLNIENNTKVVIEEGAKLVLNTGAIINLNGLNAVLELNEGQIVLTPGANVTINAGGANKGFVRVINNWTMNDVPTIIAMDKNCSFTIAGPLVDFASCADKKILEVHGNIGFVTDWDLKQLNFKNGFIAMDKGARITSNAFKAIFTTLNINYLTNVTDAGDNKHNGIYIPSKYNQFTDVTISNAEAGITFYDRGGNQEFLNLDNVRIINHTSIGVMQVGGAFTIKNNCLFDCTGMSIKTVGCSFNSTFRNSTAKGSIWPGTTPVVTGIPMDYHGSGSLFSYKGKFGTSMAMAMLVKDAKLRLRCSELNNSDINLSYMNARYIELQTNAYNNFLLPTKTQIKGFGNTNFQVNNGKNYFANKVFDPAQLFFDIKLNSLASTTPNPNTASLATLVKPAYGNYFNLDNTAALSQGGMVAAPNAGFNYSVFQKVNNTSNFIEFMIDPPSYRNGDFIPDMDESCMNERHQLPSPVVGGGQTKERYNGDYPTGGQQSLTMQPPPPNISPVKTGEQGGIVTYKPLYAVVKDNYNRINTGTILGLDSAIKELSYIVSHNNDNPNLILRSADIEDMQYAYTMLNDAYAFVAVGADSIAKVEQTQTQRVLPYVNIVSNAFQQVWISAITDSSSIWQDIKYHVATDWAQIHRLANNRAEALNVLNNTEIEISNPIENIGLNKWKCVNQMEIALMQDSTLTLDSALNLYTCILEEPTIEYLDMLQNMENMGNGNAPYQIQNLNKLTNLTAQKQFALYPNPVNDALTISVNKQVIQSIAIYDMHGKLLLTQTPNVVNLCQINLNNLPEGIYSVVVKTNATMYNQKITVVHNN